MNKDKEIYEFIFGFSPFAILVFDDQRCMMANEPASVLFGYDKHEFKRLVISDLICADTDGSFNFTLFEEGQRCQKIDATTKDKEVFPAEFRWNIFPYQNKDYFCLFVRDLSGYKKARHHMEDSKEYTKILFRDSHIPLVVMDAGTFQYLDCNDAAIKIYGFNSREETLSKTPADVSTPFQYNGEPSEIAVESKIKQAIEKGSILFEWQHQRPNGEIWDAEVQLMRFNFRDKLMLQFSLLDITERKLAQKALIENEQKYKTLFETANDAIFIMDKFVFLDCNDKTLQIFSCTRDQIINHSPVDFSPEFQPDGQLSTKVAKEKIVAAFKGVPQFFEWTHCRHDRTPFEAEVSLNQVFINGEYLVQAIVRDISERKKAEKIIREAEEKFRIISKNSNDVIWMRDFNFRFTYVSPSCSKLLGYSVEETMELSYEQMTTPEYAQLIYDILQEEFARESDPSADPGRTRIIEIQEIRKDGKLIWTETLASFIRDKRGTPKGILGVTRDITDRKRVQDELRKSEQRFRITAEKTGELIYEYSINTGEVIWSGAVESITGYSYDEFQKIDLNQWAQLIHPDDREKALLLLDKAIKTRSDYHFEYRFCKKGGEYICIEDRGVVLPPDQNGISRMYGTMINITERKKSQLELEEKRNRLEEQNKLYQAVNEELTESNRRIAEMNAELLSAKEKAEESDRLKSAFLANMSHEIRTPMNGLIGFAELIIQQDITNEMREMYAGIINNSCNQLLSTINDVIDISKIETNQVIIREKAIRPDQLLFSLYQFFNPVAETKKINLNYIAGDFADGEFITDETKLNQILNNLINNALKFTHEGSVSFGYQVKDKFLEFFVKDTGIGIEAQYYEMIFKRFSQVDMGSKRSYGGTGLGLSISKAYVKALGGDIWLNSEPNKGTAFYFTIPFKRVIPGTTTALTNETENLPKTSLTALVAEDEEVNFKFLEVLLHKMNFQVIHADNGQKAVDYVEDNPDIDLILMDIKMPVMSGIEATKRIKSINPDIPVIATTAYALGGDKEQIIEAGCDDYISKPIKSSELIALIKKFLKNME